MRKTIDMSVSNEKTNPKESIPNIPIEEYSRSRQEGAFLSPFGTEGCQWDGFPEYPEDLAEDGEFEQNAGEKESE
jgi:hypothetical protein